MEGLSLLEWTDSPGTIYPVHTHPYVQVHVILNGHLRVGLPETAEEIILNPGDRLDLPPETPHWEEVHGSETTTYLAATCAHHNHTELNPSSAKPSKHGK
jgi:quercetin dioxygenase-like cupin family protein